MKKVIIALLFFIVSLSGICGAGLHNISIVKSKIKTVNQAKLKKIILRADVEYDIGKNWRPLNKKEYLLLRESKFSLPLVYLDDQKRVRKFIYTKNYSDFDEKGSLVAVIFNNGIAAEYDIWGSMYYLNGKIVKISSLNDLIEAGKKSLNTVPSKKYLRYDLTANLLLKRYNIKRDSLTNVSHAMSVVFKTPAPGDITVINTNDIRFRVKPKNSRVITKLNTFNEVKVLEIGVRETIEPYGAYHWYKVFSSTHKKTGYVFGAFLEPVETPAK